MNIKNKNLGIVIILLAIFLPTYLILKDVISEVLFGLMVIFFLIAGFLIYKIDEIIEFETKFIKLKTLQKEIYAKAEEVKRLSKELNSDRQELRRSVRVFIETLYLTLSSRHRFPIPQKISDEITKNLNILANLAIKNQTEKGEWKKRMDEVNKLLEAEVK